MSCQILRTSKVKPIRDILNIKVDLTHVYPMLSFGTPLIGSEFTPPEFTSSK